MTCVGFNCRGVAVSFIGNLVLAQACVCACVLADVEVCVSQTSHTHTNTHREERAGRGGETGGGYVHAFDCPQCDRSFEVMSQGKHMRP